jgi:hypothetical protein
MVSRRNSRGSCGCGGRFPARLEDLFGYRSVLGTEVDTKSLEFSLEYHTPRLLISWHMQNI